LIGVIDEFFFILIDGIIRLPIILK